MDIAIIGGGAAGFFAAINIKELSPKCNVTIYEGGAKPLAKVAVSGGGRCNLTNSFEADVPLSKIYPRGERVMRNCFKIFDHYATYVWFENHGIKLTTQDDHCVFPQSQDSVEIIETFLRLSKELGIDIRLNHKVETISPVQDGYEITTSQGKVKAKYDIVVATTGGSPKPEGLSLYGELSLKMVNPIPSLFTFNINSSLTELTGAVIEKATLSLKGSKYRASGALLITHWGVSGPAVLKLSSYAAKRLFDNEYRGEILINWADKARQEDVSAELSRIISDHSKKFVGSVSPFQFSTRLWQHLLERSNISLERRWAEIGTKGINRIIATIIGDEYQIEGRGTNKEEFVTCGGIATSMINPTTMESREFKNLYFAGEVLDIDAITGGFNLQAAWSTAYVAALDIETKIY